MWYKETEYNKSLLNPILKLKSGMIRSDIKNIAETFNYSPDEGLENPHHTYILGLKQLQEQKGLPDTPGSLRLMEKNNQKMTTALFEVTLNESKPELIQMNSNKDYFESIENSLNTLKKYVEQLHLSGELRLLKMPALNIEAFWMHFEKKDDDVMKPIKLIKGDTRFDWERVYLKDQFWALLRDHAAKINIADDLTGG
jgi:hypothetical protein